MQKIKLIAFDLDGTIPEKNESIPKDAKVTLTKTSHAGIKITTATGH